MFNFFEQDVDKLHEEVKKAIESEKEAHKRAIEMKVSEFMATVNTQVEALAKKARTLSSEADKVMNTLNKRREKNNKRYDQANTLEAKAKEIRDRKWEF